MPSGSSDEKCPAVAVSVRDTQEYTEIDPKSQLPITDTRPAEQS